MTSKQLNVRQDVRSLEPHQKARLINAILKLKKTADYHQTLNQNLYDMFPALYLITYANASANLIQSFAFFPWHRIFLYEFECRLQYFDPGIVLPFWDWSRPESTTAVLNDDFMGLNGFFEKAESENGISGFPVPTNPTGIDNPEFSHLDCGLGKNLIRNPDLDAQNLSDYLKDKQLSVEALINNILEETSYEGTNNQAGFVNKLKVAIYDPVRQWIGGHMASLAAPNDPLFFFHVCMIDRLWTSWQHRHKAKVSEFESLTSNIQLASPQINLEAMFPLFADTTRLRQQLLNTQNLGYIYPDYTEGDVICSADFTQENIKTLNDFVEIGSGTHFNEYYRQSWILHEPGQSFVELSFYCERVHSAIMSLVHLTAMTRGLQGYAPINITINGQLALENHNVPHDNYLMEHFSVGDYIQAGHNTLRLDYLPSALTSYWIQSLVIRHY